MPLLPSIAHRVLRGRASHRLARAIPDPIVRYAAVTAVSALLPMIVAALSRRRPPR